MIISHSLSQQKKANSLSISSLSGVSVRQIRIHILDSFFQAQVDKFDPKVGPKLQHEKNLGTMVIPRFPGHVH